MDIFFVKNNGSLIPLKIIRIHFTVITQIPGDTLLTKMPAVPSTKQIFTETSPSVPLILKRK